MAKTAYHNGSPGNLPPDAPRDAIRIEFARRLQQRMTAAGLNQSELARRAARHTVSGIFGRDNVSNYVRGNALPGPVHLAALAKALECQPQDLLPTKGRSAVGKASPSMDISDAGEGMAWLRINQAVPWATALEVGKLINSIP